MDELAELSDEPILIYCATGNRSTVASKLLIDKGFTRIFNLRHGIVDWVRNKYPIVK
jgi:rhodanese-related sulfurtransferase